MQWSEQYHRKGLNGPGHDPKNRNRTMVINGLLVLAVCFCVASYSPRELLAASLSSLLFFAAIGSALAALFRREALFDVYLTNWDIAVVFLMISIILSWLVDPDAVRAALESGRLPELAGAAGKGITAL